MCRILQIVSEKVYKFIMYTKCNIQMHIPKINKKNRKSLRIYIIHFWAPKMSLIRYHLVKIR